MPEFIVKTYAPRGATGLAARCADEAATADRASEPGPARNDDDRDRDDVQQVGVGGLAHVVPGGRLAGDAVGDGAGGAGYGGDGGTDGRHLMERGVRARVTDSQGGIEPNGPAVSADELAFGAIGGPGIGRDTLPGQGGQRARAAERGMQRRQLAWGEGDPLTSNGPVRLANWGSAASRCSAAATGAGSFQAGLRNRSTTVVGLLVAAGKWAARTALPAVESEPAGAAGVLPKPAGL
jgi:hypothetical protein